MRTKGMNSIKKVTVRIGRTYNIGNYESVRIDVGCELEHKDGAAAADTVELADEFCENAMKHLEHKWGADNGAS